MAGLTRRVRGAAAAPASAAAQELPFTGLGLHWLLLAAGLTLGLGALLRQGPGGLRR